MKLKFYIREHQFNDQYDYKYFASFAELLQLDLNDETLNALFKFLEYMQDFRTKITKIVDEEKSCGPIFYKDEKYPLIGYTILGFDTEDVYNNLVATQEGYVNTMNAMHSLYKLLGWKMSDSIIIEYEVGDFQPGELRKFSNLPKTLEEVRKLYTDKY